MTDADAYRGKTRASALQEIVAAFGAAGLDTPDVDARVLLAHALGIERLHLLTERDAPITPAAAETVAAFVARRLAREPVWRIVGERWFYGRPFRVTPATLDPRPESETLVETALSLVCADGMAAESVRLLDIGTGTGCLLLTLLSELPRASGIGTDVSPEALAVAADNHRALAARLTEAERAAGCLREVAFRRGSVFAPVAGETFNLIVSNPPYIPSGEIHGLEAEVRAFDPLLALDGGADGLDVYRRIAAGAPTHLDDGWIVLEVGKGQADAVAGLLRAAYAPVQLDVRTFADLAGIARCVAATPRR